MRDPFAHDIGGGALTGPFQRPQGIHLRSHRSGRAAFGLALDARVPGAIEVHDVVRLRERETASPEAGREHGCSVRGATSACTLPLPASSTSGRPSTREGWQVICCSSSSELLTRQKRRCALDRSSALSKSRGCPTECAACGLVRGQLISWWWIGGSLVCARRSAVVRRGMWGRAGSRGGGTGNVLRGGQGAAHVEDTVSRAASGASTSGARHVADISLAP